MPSQKSLIILRHAKAVPTKADLDDHERPLDEQGQAEARHVGQRLAALELRPDLIFCSSSVRTRQTAEIIQSCLPEMPITYSKALYLASPSEILKLVAECSDDIKQLLIIGHNPGAHELAIKLARGGEEKALNEMTLTFPTAAVAAINFENTSWDSIARAGGMLRYFITP
ncbi:MAG: histidine phosphatase family protein [Rickettsiales bacterium]|nr:histidine phosphatase family protein [Rickettsiales bacterium]